MSDKTYSLTLRTTEPEDYSDLELRCSDGSKYALGESIPDWVAEDIIKRLQPAGTCRSCKWWNPRLGEMQGECGALGTSNCFADLGGPSQATGVDREGFGCPIITGPEYGCTHHEPKANDAQE